MTPCVPVLLCAIWQCDWVQCLHTCIYTVCGSMSCVWVSTTDWCLTGGDGRLVTVDSSLLYISGRESVKGIRPDTQVRVSHVAICQITDDRWQISEVDTSLYLSWQLSVCQPVETVRRVQVYVWQYDTVTVWHCDSVTVWQDDSVTVSQCDSVTVWQCHSMTVW